MASCRHRRRRSPFPALRPTLPRIRPGWFSQRGYLLSFGYLLGRFQLHGVHQLQRHGEGCVLRNAATATAVVANPAAFAIGASLTLTATVTGQTAGTLTGPVTFTTAGTTIGSVKQVTLASGNTATATLTVTTAASLGFVAGTDTIRLPMVETASTPLPPARQPWPSLTRALRSRPQTSPSRPRTPGHTAPRRSRSHLTGGYWERFSWSVPCPVTRTWTASSGSSSVPLAVNGTPTTTLTITTVAGGKLPQGSSG